MDSTLLDRGMGFTTWWGVSMATTDSSGGQAKHY